MDPDIRYLYIILLKLKRKIRFVRTLPMYYEVGFSDPLREQQIIEVRDQRGKIRLIDTVFICHHLYDVRPGLGYDE